jgi:hypothetical protein
MAGIVILVATISMDHHLHMRPGNDHLFDLCQCRQMGRKLSRVHLVVCGHVKGRFVAPISQEAGMADLILQIHAKPARLTTATGLHLHLFHRSIETLYERPLFGREEALGLRL